MARILVIDDHPQIREMLKQFLESAEYEAGVAPDGRGGLKFHWGNRVDLVIADIVMPEK